MHLWPPAQYSDEGHARRAASDVIRNGIKQANHVQKKGLPAVLSLGHLAFLTEVPYAFLREVIERRVDPYRSFPLRKRSGGFRTICIPDPRLHRVQRWIHDFILTRLSVHSASCAYAPKSSVLKCASMHSGCRWLVKVDVRRFFESISEIQVFRLLHCAGYQPLVAFELARVMTRVSPNSRVRYLMPPWTARDDQWEGIASYYSRRIGHLPQGAPSSPMAANVAMYDVDTDIANIATSYEMVYGRYSDDLVLSTHQRSFTYDLAVRVAREVKAALNRRGLRAHATKTRIVGPSGRRIVLGLIVNAAQPRLSKSFRDSLRAHLYYARRFGVSAHATRRGFESLLSFRRHLEGLVGYANTVDGVLGARFEKELGRLQWPI